MTALTGRRVLIGAAVALPLRPALAQVVNRVQRPVRIVVPWPPGATNDIVARLLSERLPMQLGVAALVENRPGGGGIPGTLSVARAAPDGTTLLLANTSLFGINVSLRPNLPYDPLRDFEAVSLVATAPSVLVMNARLGVTDLAGLIAWLRRQDGRANYGSGGIATPMHLSAELFRTQAGVRMEHVPFQGSAPAVTALLGEQIDLMFDNIPSVLPHIRAGTMRAIVATGPRRLAQLPDVPTFAEAGFPNTESRSFFALAAPKGTPQPIVDQLSAATAAVAAEPAFRARIDELGGEAEASNPADTRRFFEREIAFWAGVVQSSGAKVE